MSYTLYQSLLVLLTTCIGAVATPANAAWSSRGGLRRIRYEHLSPHISHESKMMDESKAIDHAFGRMKDISETETFFRHLIGGSVSMTSTSSGKDKANISNDDPMPVPKQLATTAPSPLSNPSHDVDFVHVMQTPSTSPKSSPPMPTMTPTFAPTPTCNHSEVEQYEELLQELGIVSMSDLADSSTPQGKAFDWIVSIDKMQLCPGDDRLIQRYAAAVLYFSTGGENWNDNTLWLSTESECEWSGLTCNSIGEVSAIKLDNNNLEGTVPMELGTLLIAESIEIHNNNIQGIVPTSICDNISPLGSLGILTADCDGDEDKPALLECNCCTLCY